MALFPGLPRSAGTRKVKPIWILLKHEIVSGSGISWAICKSARRSKQITTPAPHHSVFLQAGCPSCRPTKSVGLRRAHYYYSTLLFKYMTVGLRQRLEKRDLCGVFAGIISLVLFTGHRVFLTATFQAVCFAADWRQGQARHI